MLAPLQIVDSVRLSIESLGIDTYTFSHTQGDIHDSATIRKDTIRASTGAISTNLSAHNSSDASATLQRYKKTPQDYKFQSKSFSRYTEILHD